MKKIIEPQGYFLKDVRLTAAGRQKVKNAFDWHFCGGWAVDAGHSRQEPYFYDEFHVTGMGTAQDWIFDIEADAIGGLQHPLLSIEGETVEFIENIDFVIEMQSEEAFELEKIAKELNKLHEVFEQELNRLGW